MHPPLLCGSGLSSTALQPSIYVHKITCMCAFSHSDACIAFYLLQYIYHIYTHLQPMAARDVGRFEGPAFAFACIETRGGTSAAAACHVTTSRHSDTDWAGR